MCVKMKQFNAGGIEGERKRGRNNYRSMNHVITYPDEKLNACHTLSCCTDMRQSAEKLFGNVEQLFYSKALLDMSISREFYL